MKEIQLSKGKIRPNGKRQHCKNMGKYVALVDDDDYDYLNQWDWKVVIDRGCFYVRRGNNIAMHREVLGLPERIIDGICGDHIDHNGLNCQKHNLRIATRKQNSINRNSERKSTSMYLGVSKDKNSGLWRSQIRSCGKVIHLGRFKDEIEAAKAYDDAAKTHHKEFANLNFK